MDITPAQAASRRGGPTPRRGGLLILAAAVLLGCAQDRPPRGAAGAPHQAGTTFVLTGDRAGPVPAVATRAQAVRSARLVRDTVELGDEALPESVAVLAVGRDTVRAFVDSGRVYRLSVTSPAFRTADALGAGTPLARLLREPGVHAFVGEGAVYVQVPRHCGLSFRLADSGELGDASDSVGAAALGRLPGATPVSEVRVLGCARPTPAAGAAGAAADAGCPARDFPAFVRRFAEDAGVQARFTRFPLEDVSYDYGVDEAGREDTGETVRRLGRADVRWPLLPPRRRREADSLALRVDADSGRTRAVLFKPDTDYQIVYLFAPSAGCWQLVRVEDQSL